MEDILVKGTYICSMNSIWYGNNFKLGVLGGGQLGRMLIQEAINYDVHVHCMDNDPDAPCSKIANSYTLGKLTDYDDVMNFGKDKDVITVEIEHVNVQALKELEAAGVKVYPQPHILEMIQDKGLQKEFYQNNGIPTAPFALVNSKEEIFDNLELLPVMQKLRKGGYDGKGVQAVKTEADIAHGFDGPCVLESFVDFKKELSVIVARNAKGEIKTFPTVECEFSKELNLVEFLFSPAEISEEVEVRSQELAKEIIEKLDMVGILAIEYFLTQEDELLVNEIAPRPHNSGHHTIEANLTSQFEQHLRAITNTPLGDTAIVQPGVMINVLGDPNYEGPTVYDGLDFVMQQAGAYAHMYGKASTKPNRKMGHITVINPDLEKAKETARVIKSRFKVISE
ncbi:5-(carboxyamino)imidazole ribonucleotide synthase [Lishizhenia tianjinensis]|uniref:N5-carboxyaminoimidazole ribonucleotide synthase n=1 Tax=Lishizhenia tianjinensis TaxID=477690 RepID=A0A1I7BMN1_9FLAO|nr:5-(carboxyamino)imidazole ribonucleotide synthase [Lishizhenia tianjinensis]SFT88432.1 5-(carboxyamino)imidazole ribonucleotide synthase [Lishizhenia tianjinensis]